MKNRLLILLIATLSFPQVSFSKSNIPVIRASSKTVSIKDGDSFYKDSWTIVPEEKFDIHITSSKNVTFYTDLDSISFKINPKVGTYDFIILLNGTDSAHTRIQYRAPYLETLRKAKKFDYSDTRYIPAFTYQSADAPELVNLRKELKLDSIAGQGGELTQILNLLHWLHYEVRHDGSSKNPKSKNAIDLLKVCKAEGRGINCRMMAIALNECYLSMGIKSRYVTCMPKDTIFDDCHVINAVYSKDLKKWIWIDPTFDAYVMDEKGELLGIQEVRERLISGKMLILNPDANWNRQTSQAKEWYLNVYMAKNLYRVECVLNSEYDAETAKEGKEPTYVELLPLDAFQQTPQREELNSKGMKFIRYKTNNPNLFWAKLE